MKTFDLEGTIDPSGRLIVETPLPLRPGRVRVRVDVDEEDAAEGEEEIFRAMVAHSWADSLNDPREDLYTLADGVPIDPATGEAIDEAR